MTDRARYGWIAGRVLLSLIFILSALGKLANLGGTAQFMAAAGIPLTRLFLAGAIVFELGGGIFVATGYRARVGALALIVFLIPTTLIFHDFWTVSGLERQTQLINFMKNFAIMGGLLLVVFARDEAS